MYSGFINCYNHIIFCRQIFITGLWSKCLHFSPFQTTSWWILLKRQNLISSSGSHNTHNPAWRCLCSSSFSELSLLQFNRLTYILYSRNISHHWKWVEFRFTSHFGQNCGWEILAFSLGDLDLSMFIYSNAVKLTNVFRIFSVWGAADAKTSVCLWLTAVFLNLKLSVTFFYKIPRAVSVPTIVTAAKGIWMQSEEWRRWCHGAGMWTP